MVIVMLMRHGNAAPPHRSINDYKRELTNEGRQEVECVSKCIERPSIIYSSPYTRARQTAEILSKRFGVRMEIQDLLKPDIFNINTLFEIAKPGALLVGHNPSLESVLLELGIRVSLSTASVAAVNLLERKLLWLCTSQNCSRVC